MFRYSEIWKMSEKRTILFLKTTLFKHGHLNFSDLTDHQKIPVIRDNS